MQIREVTIPEPTTCFLPNQGEIGEGKESAAEPRGVEFMVGFEIELSAEASIEAEAVLSVAVGLAIPNRRHA